MWFLRSRETITVTSAVGVGDFRSFLVHFNVLLFQQKSQYMVKVQ